MFQIGTEALNTMRWLRQLTNCPLLLEKPPHSDEPVADPSCESSTASDAAAAMADLLPDLKGYILYELASKVSVLKLLLANVWAKDPTDKIVLVSHSTQMLDVLQRMMDDLGYTYLRLDGSVSSTKRGEMVDKFNKLELQKVFLLSAKAGGIGLNLVRANRIILFDPDWNPSIDLQSLARVWREGQKKHVYAYRLFTTGTIEEKIFQRQLAKTALSDTSIDDKINSGKFSTEELKRIFSLNVETACDTLESLAGQQPPWQYQCTSLGHCIDSCLQQIPDSLISFVGWKTDGKVDPSAVFHPEAVEVAGKVNSELEEGEDDSDGMDLVDGGVNTAGNVNCKNFAAQHSSEEPTPSDDDFIDDGSESEERQEWNDELKAAQPAAVEWDTDEDDDDDDVENVVTEAVLPVVETKKRRAACIESDSDD